MMATDDQSICQWKWNSNNFDSFISIYKVQHIFLGSAEHILQCVPHLPPGWFKYGCLILADVGHQNRSSYEETQQFVFISVPQVARPETGGGLKVEIQGRRP